MPMRRPHLRCSCRPGRTSRSLAGSCCRFAHTGFWKERTKGRASPQPPGSTLWRQAVPGPGSGVPGTGERHDWLVAKKDLTTPECSGKLPRL
ncbi:MAG: hypothetical protein OZSIB_4145 [Candidatus Ozemobacter sibiricus]|uniref:Uncharacterized protein n=1 Tax=Candidatus Ozemobacter sibiricus TaxID=2268124 RepID=A0A367ZNI0_9BACT|nr:MAG: hypothetical protein OZSIB_4145 [Candidatus Ozemobacter sibiricus]